MKLRNLLITLGLTLTVGAGVAVAVNAQQKEEPKAAYAYDKGTTYYYLTGKFGGTEHWTDYIAAPSDGNNAGVLLNQQLTAGDTFKFKQPGNWDNTLSFGNFYSEAGAYNAFYWQKGDSNTYCGVTGTYNFYIWNDSGSMKISAEFADNYNATYSYVITNNSETPNTYLYMDGDDPQKQREWDSAPSCAGQAYDIKISYGNYDYYGLYKIDDRILSGWTHLIMKGSGDQSATIGRTQENKQELYMCGSSVVTKTKTTNEYKAIEFLYDLVSHRGAASYGGTNFAFSICATDKATATSLVSAYESIGSGAQSFLANASCYTYDVSGTLSEYTKTYQSVEDMVNALRSIANRGTGIGARIFNLGSESGQSAMLIVVIISSLGILTGGAYYFFRKSRKTEE